MTDLIEFLRARVDEDERIARAAADRDGEHWEVTDEGDLVTPGTGGSGYSGTGPWGGSLGETGTHIVRHDPTRVLAEVDAKRRVIDECENVINGHTREGVALAEITLRMLALPYADHPDYREEWRS